MTIEPQDVMNIGDRLLEQYAETFSTDFNENKEAVRKLTDVSSILLQNRIAGYITRQKKP